LGGPVPFGKPTKRRLTLRFIVVDRALPCVFKDQLLAERLKLHAPCGFLLLVSCRRQSHFARSLLAVLANYSMQASIRLHETRRTRAEAWQESLRSTACNSLGRGADGPA